MKRVFHTTILFVAVVAVFVSCSDKHENTIANLKVAITRETNASKTYEAFAAKATEEGYRNISNMFRAVAAAEAIHIDNHNNVLKKLGEPEFMPAAETPSVNSTEENIQAAINGEDNEYTVIYPGFIATAKKENCKDAVSSFTWANLAEKNHSEQFSEALKILRTTGDRSTPSKWFVCAQCGGIFKISFTKCLICKADTDRQYFIPKVFDAERAVAGNGSLAETRN